jgi:hypothetical protein
MKFAALTLIILFAIISANGQQANVSENLLGVQRRNLSGSTRVFKPSTTLYLTTTTGQTIVARNYTISTNQINLDLQSLPFNDISSLSGRVRGNYDRKILGYTMIAGGLFMGWTVNSIGQWASRNSNTTQSIVPSLPYYGIAIGGALLLAVPPKYNTRNWEMNMVSKSR